MNAIGHYREAERALEAARQTREDIHPALERYYLAEAQIHATLALVGATIAERSAPYSDENAALYAATTEGA